jgi:hypothetical protein
VQDESDESQKREELLREITTRIKQNHFWGAAGYNVSQLQGWLTVVASFGSAIAAAAKAPSIIVAIAAAIPGTVILMDRNFGFARRAQWHWSSANKLLELVHALKYQGGKVCEISKKYTALRQEMEEKFPITPNLPPAQRAKYPSTAAHLVAGQHTQQESSDPPTVSGHYKPASNGRNDPAMKICVSRHFPSKQARINSLMSGLFERKMPLSS